MKRIDRIAKKMRKAKINPDDQTVTFYYLDYDEFTPKEIEYFEKEPSECPTYLLGKICDFFDEQGHDIKTDRWDEPIPMEKRIFKKSYVKHSLPVEEAENMTYDKTKGKVYGYYNRGDFNGKK